MKRCYYYKCKMCGKVFANNNTECPESKQTARRILFATMCGISTPKSLGNNPELECIHQCENEAFGVAELVGLKETE